MSLYLSNRLRLTRLMRSEALAPRRSGARQTHLARKNSVRRVRARTKETHANGGATDVAISRLPTTDLARPCRSPNRKPSSCGREAACLPFGEQRAHTHPNTHPVAQCFSRYANVGRPCLSRTTGNASAKQPTYHKSTNEVAYGNRARLRPDSTVFVSSSGHLPGRETCDNPCQGCAREPGWRSGSSATTQGSSIPYGRRLHWLHRVRCSLPRRLRLGGYRAGQRHCGVFARR